VLPLSRWCAFVCLGEIIALKPRDAKEIYIKKGAVASPFFAREKNLCN